MNFCIATIEFWQSVGFDTTDWRTSTDGLKAMCHDKFAYALVDSDNPNINTYSIDSDEFLAVIEQEFTERGDIDGEVAIEQ